MINLLREKRFDEFVSQLNDNPTFNGKIMPMQMQTDAFYTIGELFQIDHNNDDRNVVTDNEALYCINELHKKNYNFSKYTQSAAVVFSMIVDRGMLKSAWRLIELGYPKDDFLTYDYNSYRSCNEYVICWMKRLAMFATPISGVTVDTELIEQFYKNIFGMCPSLFDKYVEVMKWVKKIANDREAYTNTWRVRALTDKRTSGHVVSKLSNMELYESRKTRECPNFLQNREIAYFNSTSKF